MDGNEPVKNSDVRSRRTTVLVAAVCGLAVYLGAVALFGYAWSHAQSDWARIGLVVAGLCVGTPMIIGVGHVGRAAGRRNLV